MCECDSVGEFSPLIFYCACELSHFSCVQLFATPWTIACQAPLSTGSSRQEYWSGLPCLPPEDLPNPGIEPRSPALQVDLLPTEPPGMPKNTRVGSLSLLQGIFPTQESNWSLLHCRRILYQLSYQRISVVHPKWKHKGKGILGNVVQPSWGDTSFVEYIKFSININTYWVIE